MKIEFNGIVTLGDGCRVYKDENHGAIRIGDEDLIERISEAHFENPVTVAIADESFSGDLSVDLGWGYSEYTPVESDFLRVGPHNIIDILRRKEGQIIRLIIADEPVNVLD